MAHSYIYAKNDSTERTIAVPDSVLILFLHFFNKSVNEINNNSTQQIILRNYKREITELRIGDIELMLQKISNHKKLKSWYILALEQMKLLTDEFGNEIDNTYLNNVPELVTARGDSGYPKPIKTSLFYNLINDIHWILNVYGYQPSGQYKWFEENITLSSKK